MRIRTLTHSRNALIRRVSPCGVPPASRLRQAGRLWVGLVFAVCLLTGLSSCDRLQRDGRRIQRTWLKQERRAMRKTQDVIRVLQANNLDSLQYYAQTDDDITFCIYRGSKPYFWSETWINATGVPFQRVYDRWVFRKWNNAYGLCRRTRVGDDYFVLTIIPLKYKYLITSDKLRNTFVAPFRGNEAWTLTGRQGDKDTYYPIYAEDGSFLFSVCRLPDTTTPTVLSNDDVFRSFSYQSVLGGGDKYAAASKTRLRLYYSLVIILFIVLVVVGVVGVVRAHGFRNMKLGGKFQLVLGTVLLVVFFSNFLLSVLYIRKMFVLRQQQSLQEKAQYVQKALQNMYFWAVDLTPQMTEALNIDLRDVSYAYNTDIHVYDLQGQVVGSSTPQLFELGILSAYISSEPFFADTPVKVRYEQIGDVRYLTAYTDFWNGFTKIGYIALPLFISQEQVNADVESYVVWLLPLYLVLLLLTILVIWVISRVLSKSLGAISRQLQTYQLGERGTHIDYFFHDEVGDLVYHYNELMDALAESTQRLARSEREEAWRTMARQVAHEINNPLTPMKLMLQQLQRMKGTARFDMYFDHATQALIEQVDNLSLIAQSFSAFAKMPEVNPTEVDIAQRLSSCIELLQNNTGHVRIRYIGPDRGVWVIADAEQIGQVFTNIVRNALQAMENTADGDIIILLKPVQASRYGDKGLDAQYKWVELSFSDNGPGIPAEIQDKVFVPNFTTKNTGAGLGLAISKNIVEGSGGKISFQTSEKGTTFFVYLRKKV